MEYKELRRHYQRYRLKRWVSRHPAWLHRLARWFYAHTEWLRGFVMAIVSRLDFLKVLNPFRYIMRLDWYIIKKFIGTYIFSIALIISLAVVFDVNENLSKFTSYHAPLHAIVFDYYLNFIPYFSNLFSALFVFIAVIFFTSKLAGNSEIIAMLAAGVSFKRLMRPYMI
ncbi:MAG: LptF/LptG family permease, partial [Prevotella sp.]